MLQKEDKEVRINETFEHNSLQVVIVVLCRFFQIIDANNEPKIISN